MKGKIQSFTLGFALVVALTGTIAYAEKKGGSHQANSYAGSGKTALSPQTKARVKPSKVTDSTGDNIEGGLSALMIQNARQSKKDLQDDRQSRRSTYQRGVTTSPAKPCRTC